MKIQLAGQTASRILYTHCPLCEAASITPVRSDDCSAHPLYGAELPSTIQWCGCETCGHVFTDGYFTDEAFASLLSRSNAGQVPGTQTEVHRPLAARIVRRVSEVRGALGGRWLDVGIGDGALLTTAAEFGYDAVGVELRADNVTIMTEHGYDVRECELGQLDESERFDVISMADVLEHIPFPSEALKDAWTRMSPGALLFVSMPNVDSFSWKCLDQAGTNPYWAEIEHYHNFSREHLYWLLRRNGFEPCDYGVSERYRSGMEVIAMRVEADAASD